MARDSNGNYSLAAGNPVVSGTTIESVWANTTLNDLAAAMTDSLSRTGQGGMLNPFKLVNGTVSLPALSFINNPSTGLWLSAPGDMRLSVNAVEMMRWTTTLMSATAPTMTLTSSTGNSTLAGVGCVIDGTTGGVTLQGASTITIDSETIFQVKMPGIATNAILANTGGVNFYSPSAALGLAIANAQTVLNYATAAQQAILISPTQISLYNTANEQRLSLSVNLAFPNLRTGTTTVPPAGVTANEVWRDTTTSPDTLRIGPL